jgi:hypothetical protein
MTVDNQVNLKNYSEPLAKFQATTYQFIVVPFQKTTIFTLQNQTIFTDNGLIFSDVSSHNFLKMVEIQNDVSGIIDFNGAILFHFYATTKFEIYFRKYINIPQILASTGGSIQIFLLFLSYIHIQIDSVKNYQYIINEIFHINVGSKPHDLILNEKNKNNSLLKPHIELGKNMHFQNYKSKFENISLAQNNFLETTIHHGQNLEDMKLQEIIFKLKVFQTKKLKLDKKEQFTLYLHPFLFLKSNITPNVEIYMKAYSRIKSYFNLLNIIKKLEQFEKLKDFLLDYDQKYIFDIIAKPSVIDSLNDKYSHLDDLNLESQLKSLFAESNDKNDSNILLKNMLMKIPN